LEIKRPGNISLNTCIDARAVCEPWHRPVEIKHSPYQFFQVFQELVQKFLKHADIPITKLTA